MANKVKRVDFPSTQIEIRNQMAKAIESGNVKPGEKLPSYGSVAFNQKCSTGNVVNAYKILEAEGYIKRVKNRYVAIGPKKIKTSVTELNNKEKRPAVASVSSIEKEKVQRKLIKDDIILNIKNGKYPYGSSLPKLIELGEKYNCCLTTLNRIIKELKDEGYMELHYGGRGKGSYLSIKDPSENVKTDGVEKHNIVSEVEKPKRVRKKSAKKNMEFKIISNLPNVQVAVSPVGSHSFVIHVDQFHL